MSLYFAPTDSVYFSIANPGAGNQAQIYIGVSATLNVTIVNNTGAAITLQNGSNASQIEVFLPSFFTAAEGAAMGVTALSQEGWLFSYDNSSNGLLLTYQNASGSWAAGASLTFQITDVEATAAATIGQVSVNLYSLNGSNVPAALQSQPLALNTTSPASAVDLSTVLGLGLENLGVVYVSRSNDPLSNTLFLNIKNTGSTPLYNDTKACPVTPVITVSFVYGKTPGALAPADSTGEAWNISASLDTGQNWSYTNPAYTGQGNTPVWTLSPQLSQNPDVIGTGDDANVTFAFSNIISYTEAGHTQMMVTFNNFMMNSTTAYQSATFVLDISKQNAPPARGLLNFSAPDGSIIKLSKPTSGLQIKLNWAMFYVDNIKLICNIPGVSLLERNYYVAGQGTGVKALAHDKYTLTLTEEIAQDTPVFITIQAFDSGGNYLNALQFTVFISASFLIDPAGTVYPTLFINNQTWLAANYAYGIGCQPYNQDSTNIPAYGLLYTEAQALANVPAGWRIPSKEDWQGLFNSQTNGAYAGLVAGGSSGFNAQLGGMQESPFGYTGMGMFGYYWTGSSVDTGDNTMAIFISGNKQVSVTNPTDVNNLLSVRYVKNS